MDAYIVFLHCDLDEEVYMKLPLDFIGFLNFSFNARIFFIVLLFRAILL